MRQVVALPLPADIHLAEVGPRYDRRLADKVLAAFAHAYEADEHEIAGILRHALTVAEQGRRRPGDRRRANIVHQADLWVEFVDARQAYRRATARAPADPKEVEEAGRDMLDAYRRWSDA